MKFTLDITIDVPLGQCIEKFVNLENIKHWHRGLVSVEHISGIPGEFGAKMKMNYKFNRRCMAIIETITHKHLPLEWHATYTSDGIAITQENYFKTAANNATQWISIHEYLPLDFKMRIMIWMMPFNLKKQSLQYMKDFKTFAENGTSIADA